ncbi:DEAD/DEAH box helicase [Albibacterium sp.]|uniref:DEAD/DEAH box helicase n=1 Tax=Albibacterium sp. TaxID=2952885 RepID=UPI002C769756|nr:DEAD/DEAH box helicase family protein [Albibacterium sp.]HUH18572.1 DEAD/DEAH box helicase family protein [Albibacterium sp.]
MPYFIDNKHLFNLEPQNGDGLRDCQLGAIWALKSYKTNGTNEVASLISMPTGSGKTAIMMAACFELGLSKILIVVPSKILRRQISSQFRELQILKNKNCLDETAPLVSVYEVTNRRNSREEWEAILNSHDVIVSHPNSISPYYQGLEPIPIDLIDAIFMDEAHHEPAPTWQSLNSFYKQQLKVFFTATPFRRDRKRMRAKLIYHYSLERALEKEILRPIEFRGERIGNHPPDSNEALLETAIDVFDEERVANPTCSILIRTDRIEHAQNLVTLYNNNGFNVDVIHSKRSSAVNESLIEKVKNGELDGLVCVGIASEGLDIPNLKVAVLHATPRSIPYTIQFLGRISRTPLDQEGPAILIANTDAVRGEVRRLYKSDSSWSLIIPQIVDQQMQLARHYRSSQAKEEDFQMPELNVYFSALIYSTPANFQFQDQISSNSSKFEIIHYEQADDESPLIIVTAHNKPIDWASREIYIEDLLDVHVLYHSSEHNLLFELTTSELALYSVKESIINIELLSITHGRLFKTLSQFSKSDYIMVGMKNSALTGSSHPSYKTLIGTSVQAAIRSSEGRVFGAGHAVLRLDEENTWGISTRKGRVWAMKRGTAIEFKEWCDQLCTLIVDGPIISNLPGLSFLAKTEQATIIEEIPVAIIPDALFFKAYSVTISSPNHDPIRNFTPILNGVSLQENNTRLLGTLQLDDLSFDFTFDLNSERLWSIDEANDVTVYAERRDDTIVDKRIEDVLNEYPPSLALPDGSIIVGRNRIVPNTDIEDLPSEIWKEKDWNGCNIRSEAYVENPNGDIPVINQTIELLKPSLIQNADLIFLDDGAHEIADLIYFNSANSMIHFIHCKYSGKNNAGCRKSDCDELFAQAMRSIHWISSPILLDRINSRLANAQNSKIVYGSDELLETISENYRVNNWKFNIILVQPGFRMSQVSDKNRANNNVYELVIPMFERIVGSNGNVEIWGT